MTDTPAWKSWRPPPARRLLLFGSAGMVFGVAAWTSYIHQRTFAGDHGSSPGAAQLWPLAADGVLVLASLAYNEDLAKHGKARWESKLGFLVGFAVSLAANLAVADRHDPWSWLVSGWPAVALLLAVEMLIRPDEPRKRRGRTRRNGSARGRWWGRTTIPVTSVTGRPARPYAANGRHRTDGRTDRAPAPDSVRTDDAPYGPAHVRSPRTEPGSVRTDLVELRETVTVRMAGHLKQDHKWVPDWLMWQEQTGMSRSWLEKRKKEAAELLG